MNDPLQGDQKSIKEIWRAPVRILPCKSNNTRETCSISLLHLYYIISHVDLKRYKLLLRFSFFISIMRTSELLGVEDNSVRSYETVTKRGSNECYRNWAMW